MSTSMRDKLRAKTVGAPKNFKSEKVVIDGETFVVLQPSVKARGEMYKRSKISTGDVERIDMGELQVWAVINCTYTTDGEKVFEEADADNLREQPCDSFVDELGEVALKLMRMGETEGKNSVPTPKGSSSSE
jgi:uncharacterized protein (UPF0179 family)